VEDQPRPPAVLLPHEKVAFELRSYETAGPRHRVAPPRVGPAPKSRRRAHVTAHGWRRECDPGREVVVSRRAEG